MNESMEELSFQEAEFLGLSFKKELKQLMDKYKVELSLDVIDDPLGPNEMSISVEVLHFTGIELVKGNLEFNNITSSSLSI